MSAPRFHPSDAPMTVVVPGTRSPLASLYSMVGISLPPLRFDPVAAPLVAVALPRDVFEVLDVQLLADLLHRAFLHLRRRLLRALRRLPEERIETLDLPVRDAIRGSRSGRLFIRRRVAITPWLLFSPP